MLLFLNIFTTLLFYFPYYILFYRKKYHFNSIIPCKQSQIICFHTVRTSSILTLFFIGHPNVKAFISHGGLLGTLEAIYCGVPILVIPHFGDQHLNAKTIEAAGSGVIMKLTEATEEIIGTNINKILSEE